MNYRQKPYYISKADPDGYFELNYLTPGKYRIVGFDDENSNSIYDTGKENVAFQKEVIDLQTSVSGLKLKSFPSKKIARYKEMAISTGGVVMLFEGNPEKVIVRPVGEKPADYKVTHRSRSDSVKIWFDATKENIGLTVSENLKFSYDNGSKQDTMSVFYKKPAKDEMTIANPFSNKLAPETDFRFSSNYIINKIQPENWKLESDSLSQSFTAKISELDSTQVIVKSNFVTGKKYKLTVPKNTVGSFYNRSSESVRFDFEVAKPADFGSFAAHIKNVPSQKFWIQLLDEKNEPAYQKYTNEADVKFVNLKPGNYKLRILVDNNGNGTWDSSDFTNEIPAEDAYLFKKMGEKEVMTKINIRPMWEINENWDITLEEQPAN
jgi:uncharacterized protein (DUF2141 family)